MHVTVIGAGVLGRIYGVRLAAGGDQVAFLVRSERAAEASPFVLEQVNGPRRRDALDRPERVTEVPRGTRAVLLAVRFDQLGADSPLLALLRQAPAVPARNAIARAMVSVASVLALSAMMMRHA